MNTLRAELDVLLDPLADLRRQRAEYPWETEQSLALDERYRTRQLPLMEVRDRPPLGPDDVAPGEFWPPVRSVVVPLPDDIVEDDHLASFLAELKDSEVAPLVWFEGLETRAGRLHATLVPGVTDTPARDSTAPTADSAITLVVRGPWIGRFNTGRIYLPVQAADTESARVLAQVRNRWGAPHRPLLAGFLQLHDDVAGQQYLRLRQLFAEYQDRIAIRVKITELAVIDTMDDLVLRSRVVSTLPLAIP